MSSTQCTANTKSGKRCSKMTTRLNGKCSVHASKLENTLRRSISWKTTKPGCSYWNGDGAYQNEYNTLWKELVPDYGEASTVHGELIRSLGRVQHDYYNNGNYNILSGWIDLGNDVREYTFGLEYWKYNYLQKRVNYLIQNLTDKEAVQGLIEFLNRTDGDNYKCTFSHEEEAPYRILGDAVMKQILSERANGINK